MASVVDSMCQADQSGMRVGQAVMEGMLCKIAQISSGRPRQAHLRSLLSLSDRLARLSLGVQRA